MNIFRTISSVLLICLVFFASSNFMVGMHLCGGHVQNVALFTKAEECGMGKKKSPPCHRPTRPCCEDEIIVHEGQTFKTELTAAQIVAPAALDIIHSGTLVAEIIPSIPAPASAFYNYDPPLRTRDITVSIRTFLI